MGRPKLPPERIWKEIAVGDDSRCWLWLGSCDAKGYGRFTFNGSTRYAHRVVYQIVAGVTLSPDQAVLHACDRRRCCNPAHLYLGTRSENTLDRHLKGRSATGSRHGSRTRPDRRPRGEAHSGARLTENDVRQIRTAVEHGEALRSVGRRYGITHSHVKLIVIGKSWAHIPIKNSPFVARTYEE